MQKVDHVLLHIIWRGSLPVIWALCLWTTVE